MKIKKSFASDSLWWILDSKHCINDIYIDAYEADQIAVTCSPLFRRLVDVLKEYQGNNQMVYDFEVNLYTKATRALNAVKELEDDNG